MTLSFEGEGTVKAADAFVRSTLLTATIGGSTFTRFADLVEDIPRLRGAHVLLTSAGLSATVRRFSLEIKLSALVGCSRLAGDYSSKVRRRPRNLTEFGGIP